MNLYMSVTLYRFTYFLPNIFINGGPADFLGHIIWQGGRRELNVPSPPQNKKNLQT